MTGNSVCGVVLVRSRNGWPIDKFCWSLVIPTIPRSEQNPSGGRYEHSCRCKNAHSHPMDFEIVCQLVIYAYRGTSRFWRFPMPKTSASFHFTVSQDLSNEIAHFWIDLNSRTPHLVHTHFSNIRK